MRFWCALITYQKPALLLHKCTLVCTTQCQHSTANQPLRFKGSWKHYSLKVVRYATNFGICWKRLWSGSNLHVWKAYQKTGPVENSVLKVLQVLRYQGKIPTKRSFKIVNVFHLNCLSIYSEFKIALFMCKYVMVAPSIRWIAGCESVWFLELLREKCQLQEKVPRDWP